MTHYILPFAKFIGVRERAICGEYTLPTNHASAPTCPNCHELIMADDQEREKVSIAEVVERY
jgi:ribosomal protein L32